MDIEKKASKFFSGFQGELSFSNLKRYVEASTGFSVFLTDTRIAERELERISFKFPKREKAVTVTSGGSKMIFIKKNLSEEEKISCLLHEAGHVVLGHLDVPTAEVDRTLIELQASSFAVHSRVFLETRAMKTHFKRFTFALICFSILLPVSIFGYGCFLRSEKSEHMFGKNNKIVSEEAAEDSFFFVAEGSVVLTDESAVRAKKRPTSGRACYYALPCGNCFHVRECRYVNEKAFAINSEEIAKFGYKPCHICLPE